VKDAAIEAGLMDRNHLTMMCTLSLNTKEIPTHALIHSGTTGYEIHRSGLH
jgi:hypothetical protein